VFNLEYYFASKSFAAVREAFGSAYPDREMPNKATIQRLVTTFWDREVFVRNKCSPSDRTSGIRLQEFNVAIGFVVLCVKGFMCCS
jgi:hypothetical protein